MSTSRFGASIRAQRGVTLIEVLVTMVVIAIALLGFSALQTVTMKSNRTALYHSYATMFAYDILDAMRANRTAARAGGYSTSFLDPAPTSATSVAQKDLKNWLDTLAEYLPRGDGQLSIDGSVVTVEVQWIEGTEGDGTTLAYKSFETQSSIRP
jgi:type IV pilus assembly protein PilV